MPPILSDIAALVALGFRCEIVPSEREHGSAHVHVFTGPDDRSRVAIYRATSNGSFRAHGWVAHPGNTGRTDTTSWRNFIANLEKHLDAVNGR